MKICLWPCTKQNLCMSAYLVGNSHSCIVKWLQVIWNFHCGSREYSSLANPCGSCWMRDYVGIKVVIFRDGTIRIYMISRVTIWGKSNSAGWSVVPLESTVTFIIEFVHGVDCVWSVVLHRVGVNHLERETFGWWKSRVRITGMNPSTREASREIQNV